MIWRRNDEKTMLGRVGLLSAMCGVVTVVTFVSCSRPVPATARQVIRDIVNQAASEASREYPMVDDEETVYEFRIKGECGGHPRTCEVEFSHGNRPGELHVGGGVNAHISMTDGAVISLQPTY